MSNPMRKQASVAKALGRWFALDRKRSLNQRSNRQPSIRVRAQNRADCGSRGVSPRDKTMAAMRKSTLPTPVFERFSSS